MVIFLIFFMCTGNFILYLHIIKYKQIKKEKNKKFVTYKQTSAYNKA